MLRFHWIFILTIVADRISLNIALYTAVPPSPNPASKINKNFLKQLKSQTQVERIEKGRVWFQTVEQDYSELSRVNARSIRVVASEAHNLKEDREDEYSISSLLCLNLFSNIGSAIECWETMGNKVALSSHNTFSVTCQKWDSCNNPGLSRTKLEQIMAKELFQKFGWTRIPKSKKPTYKFHILFYESSVILELLSLATPIAIDALPKPGFKLVESFALAKSVGIETGDFVIDPMCGRATFLVEAATVWPDAYYQGSDISDDQLQFAAQNCQAARVPVELRKIDARNLTHLRNSSVDKILSCPPFGRQFEKMSSNLYGEMLMEWSRVLKDSGRMALLVDMSNLKSLRQAVEKANCHVEFCRSPSFQLGRIRATILLVSKKAGEIDKDEPKEGRMKWETGDGGRAMWSTLRLQTLPSLVPYSVTTIA
jgi:SAM-dependent methyltransferase